MILCEVCPMYGRTAIGLSGASEDRGAFLFGRNFSLSGLYPLSLNTTLRCCNSVGKWSLSLIMCALRSRVRFTEDFTDGGWNDLAFR